MEVTAPWSHGLVALHRPQRRQGRARGERRPGNAHRQGRAEADPLGSTQRRASGRRRIARETGPGPHAPSAARKGIAISSPSDPPRPRRGGRRARALSAEELARQRALEDAAAEEPVHLADDLEDWTQEPDEATAPDPEPQHQPQHPHAHVARRRPRSELSSWLAGPLPSHTSSLDDWLQGPIELHAEREAE